MELIIDEDELLAKHRKERKELQGEIQKLKKSISKGDKKRKKEVTEEIAKLESDLNSKQEEELAALEASKKDEDVDADAKTNALSAGDEDGVDQDEDQSGSTVQKKSKAQKRRDKKHAHEQERDRHIREQAVENLKGPRHREMVALSGMLQERGLVLKEIPADGNCMYNALGHQLSLRNIEISCSELREKTANYMRDHRDDFLPFLTHPDTGDMLDNDQFEAYCTKTEKSPVWGGQIELRAVSEVLSVPIQVLQADIQPLLLGEDKDGHPLTVVYHLHAYRLGEHYNSVCPGSSDNTQQEQETEQEAKSEEVVD